ncbi:MAG: tripartite tricarboxylate transporter TctB family protein, partial [Clostridiales bacterium]|nr:tripartite tricarboxylate transporter TctB family protein [Clostridiales bacterium]
MLKKIKKIKLGTVIAGMFMLVSAFMLIIAFNLRYWSSKYAPGPGFIPRWASGLMLILSIVAFVQSFKEKDGVTLADVLPKDRTSRINLYLCVGGLIFFLAAVRWLGFIPTSSILLAVLFSRGTKWWKAVL